MQQVLSFWSMLDMRRRMVVVAVTVAMFAAILALARMAASPSMALLYAGLEPPAAGDVVGALGQRGVAYEVRGDSIWVPEPQRDQLRMALAADGLPAGGGAGYELLDQLSGFGTTSQMFDAAYLRAKEGELARTIAASPFVRSARVHLAVPAAQPFRRDQRSTASVTVSTFSGMMTPAQAQAVRHLVASAVAGLGVEDVSVIDAAGGLIPMPGLSPGGAAEGRGDEMKRAVERLLAARVGQGRAMVELTVEIVTERESISERRFDPQGRVMISSETEEKTNSATGSPPGVTVASNLPEGDAAQGEGSRSQGAETRERINYEVSETAREVLRAPGGVRRLTVAVLIDGLRAADGSWQPRAEAELADLRDLVASAVGFDAARGDVITIKSMEFEPVPGGENAATAGVLDRLDPMALIQLGVIASVILVLGLFVLRPLLRPARDVAAPPMALPPVRASSVPVLTGEIDDDADMGAMPVVATSAGEGQPRDPVERLRQLIAERQVESVEILRTWMEDREESR
ncbi:flagellar M-ring protein FliF [Gemmobacter megaterium]|uniref:Flagellar M-ring protein n=1 Tax=Gemmobacter megaterium TaxID=1086013 RepID=A0A1N7LVT8_9RHOB|nr:flagellar basal-body MS-ring/collar protein FliF [Gemmobacter megaterium]GGE10362.1 flagellar M-ring protein [Gemmobacter megaterium]SIS77936.1 flagellar M-ring protein FliF [Gemmobacter megaterium]